MKLELAMLKMFEIWKILGYKHILLINLYILFTLTTMKLGNRQRMSMGFRRKTYCL